MSRPASASDVRSRPQIRWGIAGTGKIAHDFCEAIKLLPDVAIHAVGSREMDTAKEFADKFNILHHFGSYEELAACSEVDVVYVCVPNSAHLAVCKMLLQHGRGVLCEKPFTCNAAEAESIVEEARKQNVFCMEGMWTRFNPCMQKLQELLKKKAIGEVKYVSCHIGFSASSMLDTAKKNKELWDRVHSTELGGGAILDVGSYGVSFASWILGPEAPTGINALGFVDKDGVDESGTISLRYGDDKFATILMSSQMPTCDNAMVMGDKGYIEIGAPWQASDKLKLCLKDKPVETFDFPIQELPRSSYPHNQLFQYEAKHVHEMLRAGKVESDVMTWKESCTIMRVLDQARGLVGVKLENDQQAPNAGRHQAPGEAIKANI